MGRAYYIASFAPDGLPRLIEVKKTNGWERTLLLITRNELAGPRSAGRNDACFGSGIFHASRRRSSCTRRLIPTFH